MASLIGTTCTVGGLAFTFQSASSDSRVDGVLNPTTAAEVFFVPDASDPLRPGFAWMGNFSLNAPAGSTDNVLRFQVLMGIDTLNPNAEVVAISAGIDGVEASLGGGSSAFAQAQNSNWPCLGACAIASATVGYSGSTYIFTPSDTKMPIPFSSASNGLVQFFAVAEDQGSVSFDSVSFHFTETPSPEPATLLLFGAGVVTSILIRRRRP